LRLNKDINIIKITVLKLLMVMILPLFLSLIYLGKVSLR